MEEEEDQLANDDDDVVEEPHVVDIGDRIPDVTLKDEKDGDVNVAELVKDKGLVLFLVPKADTRQSPFPTRHLGVVFFFPERLFCVSWLHTTSMRIPRFAPRF